MQSAPPPSTAPPEPPSLASFAELEQRLAPLRTRLLAHPVYASIGDERALRVFLEHHVYAVWDFMSLLKGLQRELSCVELPWLPRGERHARRFVHEILLQEESDEDGQGGYASHFELYREAMLDCGASTAVLDEFLAALRAGVPLGTALARSGVPEPAREFVHATFEVLATGSAPAIAAAFALGREDVIPHMFRALVEDLERRFPGRYARLAHYLKRHVELDGDAHAPRAQALLASLCGRDAQHWRAAELAARQSLHARIALWDALALRVGSRA
jgi:hypothetical protein